LKIPEEPTDGDWNAYARQWGVYGTEATKRFKAALAVKSA